MSDRADGLRESGVGRSPQPRARGTGVLLQNHKPKGFDLMTTDEALSVRRFLAFVWATARAATVNELDALQRDGTPWPAARDAFNALTDERSTALEAQIKELSLALGEAKAGAQ